MDLCHTRIQHAHCSMVKSIARYHHTLWTLVMRPSELPSVHGFIDFHLHSCSSKLAQSFFGGTRLLYMTHGPSYLEALTHVSAHKCAHTHAHAHTHTQSNTHNQTHTYTYARTHAHTHTIKHTHVRTHTHTHMQEVADMVVAFSFNKLSYFQADALAGLVAALGGWGHAPPRPCLDRVCLESYARLVVISKGLWMWYAWVSLFLSVCQGGGEGFVSLCVVLGGFQVSVCVWESVYVWVMSGEWVWCEPKLQNWTSGFRSAELGLLKSAAKEM
jgi:hypothetical protein